MAENSVQQPVKIVDVNSVSYLYAKLKSNIDQFQDSTKTAIDQFKSDAQTNIDAAVLAANNATSDAQAATQNANELVKNANDTFLSKTDAQNTYLKQSSAAEIYLGKTATAAAATKLATARTISLSGAVTGSATFDGTGDITISTAVSAGTIAPSSLANGQLYAVYE